MVKRIKVGVILIFIIVLMIVIKQAVSSNISSVEDFKVFMDGYGIWGPLVLTVIQFLQVVVPVLPGYLGCAVGALSYGVVIGYVCNYIGISLGSIAAFFLAERYGKTLVVDLFSEEMYDKWRNKINGKKSYDLFLIAAIVLPLFPDDFFCYFSGLIKMDRKRFIWIIVLGKPWCILGYSLIFGLI